MWSVLRWEHTLGLPGSPHPEQQACVPSSAWASGNGQSSAGMGGSVGPGRKPLGPVGPRQLVRVIGAQVGVQAGMWVCIPQPHQ